MAEPSVGVVPESSTHDLVLTRLLDAPRTLVFDCFTQRIHLVRWWGPDGFSLSRTEIDLRPGGLLHFVMRGPDGVEYPLRGEYLEVSPGARLVFTADLGSGPGDVLTTTVGLEEDAGRTRLTVRQTIPASAPYARGQRQGWSESLERLARYLAGR
jgi:uncharacterized protein YndB with AHSA1/START domain